MGLVHNAMVFTCDHPGCAEYAVMGSAAFRQGDWFPPKKWAIVRVGVEGATDIAYCPSHWQMRQRAAEKPIAAVVEKR